MKASVKPGIHKNKISTPKKEIKVIHVEKQDSFKKKEVSKITYTVKRYGKQVVKNILLSKVFHTFFKIFVGVTLFFAVSYGLYSHFNGTIANDVIISKSEIVDRVSKLTTLPKGGPDAIVRVEDPETLKKQNNFYQNVKSGDYIVMYPKLAIIYDLRNNVIVAIKKSE